MRGSTFILLLLGGLVLASPERRPEARPERPAAPVLRPGIYLVQGEASKPYEGSAQLRRTGDTWTIETASTHGVGMLRDGVLSVGWQNSGGVGVSVYQVQAEGKLQGVWTGGDGQVYPEKLELLREWGRKAEE